MPTVQIKNKATQNEAANVEHFISDIQDTRSKICVSFLVTFSLIAIPALIASLYRASHIGWQPVMYAHIALAMMIWGITLFRTRIPYTIQAAAIITVFIIIGLGGIFQFGLIAAGTVFLVIASPIAILFFGKKAGIITFVLAFAGVACLGSLTIFGLLEPSVDLTSYAAAPSTWINSIIGWSLASVALAASLHVFNKDLINAFKKSIEHQKVLIKREIELEKALNDIKTLQGIIPICSYCHNIRNDEGAWNHLEEYIAQHSEATFSHGICPKCEKVVRHEWGLKEK